MVLVQNCCCRPQPFVHFQPFTAPSSLTFSCLDSPVQHSFVHLTFSIFTLENEPFQNNYSHSSPEQSMEWINLEAARGLIQPHFLENILKVKWMDLNVGLLLMGGVAAGSFPLELFVTAIMGCSRCECSSVFIVRVGEGGMAPEGLAALLCQDNSSKGLPNTQSYQEWLRLLGHGGHGNKTLLMSPFPSCCSTSTFFSWAAFHHQEKKGACCKQEISCSSCSLLLSRVWCSLVAECAS